MTSPRPLRTCVLEDANRLSKKSRHYQEGFTYTYKHILELYKPESMVCSMNAETTEAVAHDVCRISNVLASSVSIRPRIPQLNLSLDAINVSRNHDKFALEMNLLEVHQGQTVILMPTESECHTMASKLRRENVDAVAVTLYDRLQQNDYTGVADFWNTRNRVLCVCSNTAPFVMHRNIRHIIHVGLNLPAIT